MVEEVLGFETMCYWILFISLSSLKNSRGHWNLYLDEVGGGKFTNAVSASAQFSHSVVSDSLQPHWLQHARLPCPSITNSWSLLKLMSIELVMASNHLILCHPLLLLPLIFTSIGSFPMSQFFTSGGQSIGVSASISIRIDEYSGLISYRMDW